jgi:cobalt-zinc-cadmium efflux system outer membrane protein
MTSTLALRPRLRTPTLLVLASALACPGCRANGHQPQPSFDRARVPALNDVAKPPAEEGLRPLPVVRLVSAAEPIGQTGQSPIVTHIEEVPAIGPSVLSLGQAIETSLAQNPDLVAARRAEGVGRTAIGVAQTYPFNPWVQVQATPWQDPEQGGPGTTTHYVLLMQTLQLAHQRDYRERSAASALSSIRWNIAQQELLSVAQTMRLYFTAQYQRGIRDLARLSADVNDELLRISERQLAAGQAAAADVAIIRLDAQSTRRQAYLAEANYQTAILDLRRQLYLPLTTPFELWGGLDSWSWRPLSRLCADDVDPQNLGPLDWRFQATELAAGRPDVLAARSDVAVARANAGLADASRTPDLQIGPFYAQNEASTTFWGFRAQMDLPVLNTGVPLLRQRVAELTQRQAIWRQLEARAGLEAQTALDRYERARLIAMDASSANESVPSELQRLEEQFKAGEVDVLRVFTARTSLIQLRRTYLDTLNEVAQAAANVTAMTGLPPAALMPGG